MGLMTIGIGICTFQCWLGADADLLRICLIYFLTQTTLFVVNQSRCDPAACFEQYGSGMGLYLPRLVSHSSGAVRCEPKLLSRTAGKIQIRAQRDSNPKGGRERMISR